MGHRWSPHGVGWADAHVCRGRRVLTETLAGGLARSPPDTRAPSSAQRPVDATPAVEDSVRMDTPMGLVCGYFCSSCTNCKHFPSYPNRIKCFNYPPCLCCRHCPGCQDCPSCPGCQNSFPSCPGCPSCPRFPSRPSAGSIFAPGHERAPKDNNLNASIHIARHLNLCSDQRRGPTGANEPLTECQHTQCNNT